IRPFKKYFHSGEINFKLKPKKDILVRLEKKYQKGKISHLDGLRIDFKNWWFLVRPSQTEPVLRLVLEAKTKKLLEKKKKELIDLIKAFC
ncbi:MAG: phosphomannomutase/phosphoglucomutase, partial [Patescibacteria group bacterium]|nr:phosphomannomutase/phosphoglucomutase [Patescibacteria group bacterium]